MFRWIINDTNFCILWDNNNIIVSWKWGPSIHSIIVWRKADGIYWLSFCISSQNNAINMVFKLKLWPHYRRNLLRWGRLKCNKHMLTSETVRRRFYVATQHPRLNLSGWHASRWNFFCLVPGGHFSLRVVRVNPYVKPNINAQM